MIILWLSHLYIYTRHGKDFPISLQFKSREFADNFSKKLKSELNTILEMQDTEYKKISDKIKDAQWFVSDWLKDKTVRRMLYVLDHIEEKYGKSPFDECDFIALLSFPNMVKTVTYSLADEIYVKRDGHGPLSYSENLKSWMEEKIISHFEDDPNFIEDWQKKWADFFCANHDKSQDHPEEIPTLPKADEQELFFRNLLRIFWTKNNNTFVPNENRELLYNELDIDVNKKLEDEIVARMEKSELSLFVFEKTNLFSKEFFVWAKKALDGISELSQQINTCSIEFDLSSDANKKHFAMKSFLAT